MKRFSLTILTIIIVLLAAVALTIIPSKHASRDLLAVKGDGYEGDSACQQCQADADALWAQCVAEEAGDAGSADCAARRQIAKNRCLTSYCLNSQQTAQSASKVTAETVFAKMSNVVAPSAECATNFLYPCDTCQASVQRILAAYAADCTTPSCFCDGYWLAIYECDRSCMMCQFCADLRQQAASYGCSDAASGDQETQSKN